MRTVAVGLAIAAAAPAFAAEGFAYAGIGLSTTVDEARKRFPTSQLSGDTIYVSDQDRREQVSGIQLAAGGTPRRVRLSFERPRGSAGRGQPQFPKCKVVESDLRARYGAPDEIAKHAEATRPRADRIWKGARETLTLVCFAGPSGELLAEAVVIAGR